MTRHGTPPSTAPLIRRRLTPAVVALLLGPVCAAAAPPAPLKPEQQAALLLNTARAAFNAGNVQDAATHFREFLAKFGTQKDVAAARFGLALSLLEAPDTNYQAVMEQLRPLVDHKEFADYPLVQYYLGRCQRALGARELAHLLTNPNEAPHRTAVAKQHFTEAEKHFAAAAVAFQGRVKPGAGGNDPAPVEVEWLARSICDRAEMLIRTDRAKDAEPLLGPLDTDPGLKRSKSHRLGRYYHGWAGVILREFGKAATALRSLAPFDDPEFGPHARYLLARSLQGQNDADGAARTFEAVVSAYDAAKADAEATLRDPARAPKDGPEKTRLEAFVKTPPEYVPRAAFGLAEIQADAGRLEDALARFAQFPVQYPASALVADAQLRQGVCLVRLKQYAEALKLLPPLVDRDQRLADQFVSWIGRAYLGSADPADPGAYAQAVQNAINHFRQAADRANQHVNTDPEARRRRGEAHLEAAAAHELLKQYREAAGLYQHVANEKTLPKQEDELLLRQIAATQLAGDFPAADGLCARFAQQFGSSPLMPVVMFRHAENAAYDALPVDRTLKGANRAAELGRRYDEVVKRYLAVVEKYPGFGQITLARFGMAFALSRKGEYEKAKLVLDDIPAADRTGPLVLVPYFLAESILRTAPARADDGLAAGKLIEQLRTAGEHLETFLNNAADRPEAPDALMKLGRCQQRIAGLEPNRTERVKWHAAARATYERLLQQHPTSESAPEAVFEHAACAWEAGDHPDAIAEWTRFTQDPLKASPAAPLAAVRLSAILRAEGKFLDAAELINGCRQVHEGRLANDPDRPDWVMVLRLLHACALLDAGKPNDARGVFAQVMGQGPTRPEMVDPFVDAHLRYAASFVAEGRPRVVEGKAKLAAAPPGSTDATAARDLMNQGAQAVQGGAQHLDAVANQFRGNPLLKDARAPVLYHEAWAYRLIAEAEVANARAAMTAEALKKLQDEAAKKVQPGMPPEPVVPPVIPLATVPAQPTEPKVHAVYTALLTEFPDAPLAADGRLELAELLTVRGKPDEALALLSAGLDRHPGPDLAARLRLRQGLCEAARRKYAEALAHFDAAAGAGGVTAAVAELSAGECFIDQQEWAKAAARLEKFRQPDGPGGVPGVADRGLDRLGLALGRSGQWEPSRQAYELLLTRFPDSPLAPEARYGVGWAWQNQGQFEKAVAQFSRAGGSAPADVRGKARVQVGLCRLEQKRYFEAATALLVASMTEPDPEVSAAALCEAGRALAAGKQPDMAGPLWQRVIREHPQSPWADAARQRLANLPAG